MEAEQYFKKIHESAAFLKDSLPDFNPSTGMILGSGLGNAIRDFNILAEIPYREIPNFPVSTVIGHKGSLLFASHGDRHIAILSGRFHYYEGYSMREITFPVRVLKALGIELLIITAAAGGLRAEYTEGELVLLRDHIYLMPDHPLRGPNDDRLGTRFPDLSDTYKKRLRAQFQQVARELEGKPLPEGVYAALQGPSLETPAEYDYLHRIGADLVGMSLVPEVLVAVHAGLSVLAVSVVSNVCYPPEAVQLTTAEMVVAVADKASVRLGALLGGFLEQSHS